MSQAMFRFKVVFSAVFALSVSVAGAEQPDYRAFFAPLPEVIKPEANSPAAYKIELGKKLYLEPMLSSAEDISCNSCHRLDSFGVDGEPTSPGHKGQRGERNSPSSFNAALHIAQFWDGRAKDVEEQALGPILNPVEMAMSSDVEVVERLKKSKEYQELFTKAFPEQADPITYKNIGVAIGAFERTLLTPSRFDDYLKGDDSALTGAELAGLKLFVETGCTACHMGVGVGGGMYQKLGLVKPYPTKDMGRYAVTKSEGDKFVFKVPSLRNIDKTGPYFHDGSIKDLNTAVATMAEYQLGKKLTEEEVNSIVTFLKSLTGSLKN